MTRDLMSEKRAKQTRARQRVTAAVTSAAGETTALHPARWNSAVASRGSGDASEKATTAASYARRSVKKDAALVAQHGTNTNRARLDGYRVPPELCWGDDGTSGTTMRRDGLDALLEVICSGNAPFKRLYIRDRDRAARTSDPRFTFFLEMLCKVHGVQLCYSTDEVHTEYGEAPSGDSQVAYILAALKSLKAYQEVVDTRIRTIRGTRIALKAGAFLGARAPYGFDRWLVHTATGAFVHLVPSLTRVRQAGHHIGLRVNAAQQVAVKAIFAGLAVREGYAEIARRLEAEAHPRPSSSPWRDDAVKEIARNPIHMGDYHYGRTRHADAPMSVTAVSTESTVLVGVLCKRYVDDAPISPEMWTRVQLIMDERAAVDRQRKHSNPTYLLTSILRCAACGDALFGHRQPERAGERASMYRHTYPRSKASLSHPPCPYVNRYVHAEPLELVALDATRRMLECDALLDLARTEIARLQSATGESDHHAALNEAQAELANTTRAAGEANRRAALATNDIERQIHDTTMRELAAQVGVLTARVEFLTTDAERLAAAEARLPSMERRLVSLRAAFDAGSLKDRKKVVAEVVELMRLDFAKNTVEVRVLAA